MPETHECLRKGCSNTFKQPNRVLCDSCEREYRNKKDNPNIPVYGFEDLPDKRLQTKFRKTTVFKCKECGRLFEKRKTAIEHIKKRRDEND